jgi:hypothetical protein
MNDTNHPPTDELRAASRVTGADLLFLQLVQLIASKQTGSESAAEPLARERVAALHEEFRDSCASIFERHLGRPQAVASLKALESAALQRFLAARQAMAPALTERLAQLKQRMGNIEI